MRHGSTGPAAAAARRAVALVFLLNAAAYANVVPRLPAIKLELGLSNTALGTAVAAMPVGALVAGPMAGWLVARVGSGRLAVACGVGMGAVLPAFAAAPRWAALAAVFAVLGGLDAVMDVAMNAHALEIQRALGRSILSGLHGLWSVGAVVGGLAGALAAGAGTGLGTHLAVAGAAVVAVALSLPRWLRPPRPGAWAVEVPTSPLEVDGADPARGATGSPTSNTTPPTDGAALPDSAPPTDGSALPNGAPPTDGSAGPNSTADRSDPTKVSTAPGGDRDHGSGAAAGAGADDDPTGGGPPPAGPGGAGRALPRLALLGLVVVMAAIIEDAPGSWGAVLLRTELGTSAAAAGSVFLGFQVAMTVGRFAGDRVVERFGAATVVRAGGLATAGGVGAGLAVGHPAAVVVGFALAGLGTAVLFPLAFGTSETVAGIDGGHSLAAVAWLGRVGFLMAPPLVGLVADAVSVRAGLATVPVAGLVVAALAGTLARPGEVSDGALAGARTVEEA